MTRNHRTRTGIGATLCAYLLAELDRAIGCLAWQGGRRHAGVHQARKSMRRTRAVLLLCMPALGWRADVVAQELRDINRSLSALRDAHALTTLLDRLIRQSDDADERQRLRHAHRAAGQRRAAQLKQTLANDPDFNRRRVALTFLRKAIPGLPWDVITAKDIEHGLARSNKAMAKAARRAQSSQDDEDWHRWRRRARRWSQQLRSLPWKNGYPALASEEKTVATHLGQAQDFALLRAHCGKDSPFSEADRPFLKELADAGNKRLRRKIHAEFSALGSS